MYTCFSWPLFSGHKSCRYQGRAVEDDSSTLYGVETHWGNHSTYGFSRPFNGNPVLTFVQRLFNQLRDARRLPATAGGTTGGPIRIRCCVGSIPDLSPFLLLVSRSSFFPFLHGISRRLASVRPPQILKPLRRVIRISWTTRCSQRSLTLGRRSPHHTLVFQNPRILISPSRRKARSTQTLLYLNLSPTAPSCSRRPEFQCHPASSMLPSALSIKQPVFQEVT